MLEDGRFWIVIGWKIVYYKGIIVRIGDKVKYDFD